MSDDLSLGSPLLPAPLNIPQEINKPGKKLLTIQLIGVWHLTCYVAMPCAPVFMDKDLSHSKDISQEIILTEAGVRGLGKGGGIGRRRWGEESGGWGLAGGISNTAHRGMATDILIKKYCYALCFRFHA